MSLRQCCWIALSCFSLTCSTVERAAAADPTIRWEIENRFRLFKNASDFREIARVYGNIKPAATPKPTALELERALENEINTATFNGVSHEQDDASYGWAATIYENTCGREYGRDCKMHNGDRYVLPQRANVLLHADNTPDGNCEWRVDTVLISSGPCQKPALAPNLTYDAKHHIELNPGNGNALSVDIQFRDALIVSMGDSFSAGEGNPDKPVRLSNTLFDNYKYSSGWSNFPVREPLANVVSDEKHFFQDLAAGWTNSQCHRSLYSQHTKAALQYALEHPHLTVTFLNYSCTGAEVYEGLLNAWWARDDIIPAYYDDAPQFVKALRDLCKNSEPYEETKWATSGRDDKDYNSKAASFAPCSAFVRPQVDALLLTIGGNDVNFARMIANAAVYSAPSGKLAGGTGWVYGLWRSATDPQDFKTGLDLAHKLIGPRYEVLNKALQKDLHIGADKVILSAYPHMHFDETGKPCKTGFKGMDVHAILGMKDKRTSAQSANFVLEFQKVMKSAATEQNWKLADDHLMMDGAANNFKDDVKGIGHGICAGGPDDTNMGKMAFPRPRLTPGEPFEFKPIWTSFPVSSWRAYSRRNRWFVTPNDAFLTTNYHDSKTLVVNDPIQPLYAATLSGAFHPNALGHAAVADSVLGKLRETLKDFEDASAR